MTSTPVKDASSVMNFVKQRGVPAPKGAGNINGGFGSAMDRASGKMNGLRAEGPVNKPQSAGAQSGPAEQARRKEVVSADGNPDNSPASPNGRQVDRPIESRVKEAGEKAVKAVAEGMEISEEEVAEVMAASGLVPVSLLESRNLAELVLRLSGQDTLALVTDEELYGLVNRLDGEISLITEQLPGETGWTPEELAAAMEQALQSAEEASGEITGTSSRETPTPNDLAGENAKEITVVIEKDGLITEVTAKADDQGNMQAVKEVITTSVETAAIRDAGEHAQGNRKGSKGSDHSGEQEPAGRNSLLESLLQNRVKTVEAFAEPVPVSTVPDTEQIMRQILDFMKMQLKPGMNRLEMQLHPENLGIIHVQIAAKAGMITAQFTAQNELVRAALESQIVELRENMREQGIKVEAVEVNVQSQSFESNLWQGKERNNDEPPAGRKNIRRINLNDIDFEETAEDMTEEEQLTAEIMLENGGTVDFTA